VSRRLTPLSGVYVTLMAWFRSVLTVTHSQAGKARTSAVGNTTKTANGVTATLIPWSGGRCWHGGTMRTAARHGDEVTTGVPACCGA
jgi:hypothetical protein